MIMVSMCTNNSKKKIWLACKILVYFILFKMCMLACFKYITHSNVRVNLIYTLIEKRE